MKNEQELPKKQEEEEHSGQRDQHMKGPERKVERGKGVEGRAGASSGRTLREFYEV